MSHVRSWLVITCAVVAGCRQHGENAAKGAKGAKDETPTERQEGEIEIALGDCAPVTTPFVSGPLPQAFTLDALKTPPTSLYSTMADGGDVSASLHADGAPAGGALQIHRATLTQAYQPGTASPLQPLRIALLECFRLQDKHYGVAVFDLGPGTLVAHGIEAPAFAKCVGELAPQVKTTEPMRCSAAFGSAPTSSLPSVDITADAISIRGRKTTEVYAVMNGEPTPWWKIESVHTAAALRVRATLVATEPLTIHGPLVVRPLPATPMKVVTKLVYTLVGAGEDPLLAAQRTGQWELLREHPLPMLPVPIGTGGSFSSDKDRVRAVHHADEPDRTYASVLVSNKEVWLGASKGQGAWHADKDLAAELTKLEASPAFTDRHDIEIAATDDAPYSRFVEVLDRVRAAGFTEWSLMAQPDLTAPPAP